MTPVTIVILMLIFSAFFSGLEIAFISANRLRIELKSNQGKHWAQICSDYFKSPSKFISTILVGNNVALVIYGVTMELIFADPVDGVFSMITNPGLRIILATIVSTMIVLVTAEFLPKALFRINPAGMLKVLIYPFQLFYFLLWPLVQFVMWLSKYVLSGLFNAEFTEKSPVFTKVDLDHFISQSAQHYEKDDENDVDTDILKNALDFGNVRVRDCLIPRTDIVAIDINETIQDLEKLFIESRHSKILVYEDNIDHIIGYVHHLDLHKGPKNIRAALLSILITNESKSANEMLNEFSTTQKSIALVVDEYGGTAGIITVEDIMEEIFGEIEDEHDDNSDQMEIVVDEGVYVFSAKQEVDLINEKYELNIPEGEYETLGGYVVANLEDIPKEGETYVIGQYEIKILEASEQRIERIRLSILE
ncbi:HlyC/CorC family transporter [bacterium]|nr:HlyC/CorC family transporter [bacterium]